MKKVITLAWVAMMAIPSFATNHNQGDFSLLFHNNMEPRTTTTPFSEPQRKAVINTVRERRNAIHLQKDDKPNLWATMWTNGVPPRQKVSGQPTEKMDSIVMTNFAGDNVSRQVLEYDQNGAPTFCYNELPDNNGNWNRIGYYAYEYDEFGRMIARESISTEPDNWYEDVRYEFVYTDDSDLFSMQVIYRGSEDGLVPYQKGEYIYKFGNPYEQTFYSWDTITNDWIPAERKVTDWLNEELQSSYFFYYWDTELNQWYGYSSITPGQTYEYTPSGQDAKITYFTWEANDWLAYEEDIFDYNERGLQISLYRNYWNEELQNWDGPYVAPNGRTDFNTFCLTYYDDKDRITMANWYYAHLGGDYGDDPIEYIRYEYEYTDYPEYSITDSYENVTYNLTDVMEERFTLSMMMSEVGKLDPYKKITQRYDRFNSEIYYFDGGQEEIRYIDNNNMYHGGDFYGFYNGSRYGLARERFYFADGWNGLVDEPVLGIHWKGTGPQTDTDWVLSNRDEFEWSHGFIVYYQGYIYDDFGENPVLWSGYAGDYDWSVPGDDIIRWTLSNRSNAFFDYKAIWEEQFVNYDGDENWDNLYSYRNDFYYSPFVSTSIESVSSSDAVEVERYNVAGTRLSTPSKGINIVKYSDGSVRKVMVK